MKQMSSNTRLNEFKNEILCALFEDLGHDPSEIVEGSVKYREDDTIIWVEMKREDLVTHSENIDPRAVLQLITSFYLHSCEVEKFQVVLRNFLRDL